MPSRSVDGPAAAEQGNPPSAKTALQSASTALADPVATPLVDARRQKIDNIRTLLVTAINGFGSNLTYQIGDGPLMF